MVLLLFVLGIILIFAMARYNESNGLFWTLLFAQVIGFAGAKMYLDVHHSNKSNVGITQMYSTQVQPATITTISWIQIAAGNEYKKVTASKPVSQGNILGKCENNIILSKVFGKVRDQPILIQIKPPELWLQKDFLTLHDSS